ncbi:hypothetical protein PAXINDRAFT_156455 [Paxillus involutus ATCC 200175]|uniref:Uncharacterized protein n=1 Tax=Paxillus involutus ATCC 200175 TaxID=664439 RepID=A0A0C9U215_PAXIN|nr:hypothetical protein PAXINDRAFT_156455 [Paxillus involutus ATCC 200175]
MPPKRRKISDLTVTDTNELLLKLDEFRSALDEGDEDLPAGLIDKLEELRDKLQDTKHTSFSKVDPITLLSLKISSGPLFLVSEKRQEIEDLGSAEPTGLRDHVATVTEAGCRILINILLLRVVSVMCPGETSVNIIPEFPLPRTTFKQDSGNYSFSGVVDFLVTKLPARYTEYLLGDPTTALANPEFIKGPMTSNIFEAKRDNVRAALPQAAIAAASYCKLRNLSTIRGVVTSGEQWLFFAYERVDPIDSLPHGDSSYDITKLGLRVKLLLVPTTKQLDNVRRSDHSKPPQCTLHPAGGVLSSIQSFPYLRGEYALGVVNYERVQDGSVGELVHGDRYLCLVLRREETMERQYWHLFRTEHLLVLCCQMTWKGRPETADHCYLHAADTSPKPQTF